VRTVPVLATVAMAALGAVITSEPAPASPVCSVFDKRPCAPTVCSPFRRGPCVPEFEPPIGQDLRLTIETASAREGAADAAAGAQNQDGAEHKLNSIRDVFAALRACWVPPPATEARPGMQMSVRLAFKRNGEIIGTPRVTYATPGAPREVKDAYHQAITAALERCTPLPFTSAMGGAIAGRPIAIRYVDNRTTQSELP
jgi:hypothetical protein